MDENPTHHMSTIVAHSRELDCQRSQKKATRFPLSESTACDLLNLHTRKLSFRLPCLNARIFLLREAMALLYFATTMSRDREDNNNACAFPNNFLLP